MSKNKHCGNCARFFNEDAKGNGFCSISPNRQVVTCRYNTCIAHEWKLPKWTEITPDNVDELYNIPEDLLIIAFKLGDTIYYQRNKDMRPTLNTLAKTGGYYYFVLPELMIDNEQAD